MKLSHLWVLALVLAATQAPAQEPQKTGSDAYSHLLYTQLVKTGSTFRHELVLHEIASPARGSRKEAIRRVATLPPSPGNSIKGVVDGRALCVTHAGATLIDLRTGEAEKLTTKWAADPMVSDARRRRFYYPTAKSTIVRCLDVATGQESVLFMGLRSRPPNMAGFGHPTIALSPDGKQLAVATVAKAPANALGWTAFDVHILDLTKDPPEARRIPRTFNGAFAMSGGGDHLHAPALYWKDDATLYLSVSPQQDPNNVVLGSRDNARCSVWSVNVSTMVSSRVCRFPVRGQIMDGRSPAFFWRRSDGQVMVQSRGVGAFRVDATEDEPSKDGRLSEVFTVRLDAFRPALFTGKKGAARQVNLADISISPDGQQAVWLVPTRKTSTGFGWTHSQKDMFHYSEATGTTRLRTGQFNSIAMSLTGESHPVGRPPIIWLRQSDLAGKR